MTSHRWTNLLALTIASGCGGSDKDSGDAKLDIAFPDAPETAEVSESYAFVELCDGFAKACCNVERCVEPGAEPEDDCVRANRGYCQDVIQGPLATHLDPGAVSYSETGAGACFAYYLGATCGDSNQFEDPPAACDTAFAGQVGEGDACAFDALCKPGLFCKPAGATCPGVCAKRLPLAAPCNGVDALCEDELVCSNVTAGGQCVARSVPTGGSCVLTSQCPPAEHCGVTGKCTIDKGLDEECPTGVECGSGLVCDFAATPHVCRVIPKEGESCDRLCAFPAICTRETKCVAAPEIGDACLDADTPCGYELECDDGTEKCVMRGGVGSACGGEGGDINCRDAYCDGDFVTAGTCRPFKRLGDPCEGFGQCGRLTCKDGKCQNREHPCRGVSSLRCF